MLFCLILFGFVTILFDLKQKRIPNFLILLMLLVFSIIAYTKVPIASILWTLLWAFGIGFGLYRLNFWNAGDGKLLIALSVITSPLAQKYSPIPTPVMIATISFIIGFILLFPFFLIQILLYEPKRLLIPSFFSTAQFSRRLIFILSTTWIIRLFLRSHISLSNPILYLLTYEIFSLIRGKLLQRVQGLAFLLTSLLLLIGLMWASINGKINLFNYLFMTGFYTAMYSFIENIMTKEQTETRIPFSPFMFLATFLICTDSVKPLIKFLHYV